MLKTHTGLNKRLLKVFLQLPWSALVFFLQVTWWAILTLIYNNSSSLNEENHSSEGNKKYTDFDDFTSLFCSSVFDLIEKTYQTLKTVLHWLSKHLKFCQKYSAVHCIFNSLLGFGYPNETLSPMFVIIHNIIIIYNNIMSRSVPFWHPLLQQITFTVIFHISWIK